MSPQADGDRLALIPPEHQPDINFLQAAPVQNTWYTILNDVNVGLYLWLGQVALVNETLEWRLTLDGEIYTTNIAAAFATWYYIYTRENFTGLWRSTTIRPIAWPSGHRLEGRSAHLEMRKTTAAGAGNLHALVRWCKWP